MKKVGGKNLKMKKKVGKKMKKKLILEKKMTKKSQIRKILQIFDKKVTRQYVELFFCEI